MRLRGKERERERETGRGEEGGRERERFSNIYLKTSLVQPKSLYKSWLVVRNFRYMNVYLYLHRFA